MSMVILVAVVAVIYLLALASLSSPRPHARRTVEFASALSSDSGSVVAVAVHRHHDTAVASHDGFHVEADDASFDDDHGHAGSGTSHDVDTSHDIDHHSDVSHDSDGDDWSSDDD